MRKGLNTILSFTKMAKIKDYAGIGLKCGIEIHQQLDTGKLFCSCPSVIRDDRPDFEVERRLRAVVGETGGIDTAASQEQAKSKSFVYQGYNDTTCLVELDEEPPANLNDAALKTVLQVSAMLKCSIVDEVQVMRKTVVDGSNTTGFQRTALVSRNGTLDTSSGAIRIPTVCLEEDSCKIMQRTPEKDIYNLSRLGIPLIEIATEPDIVSPEHAKETAEKIGMYLRSTGKVKRGLGTIRQDLNVSIKGGARIEIKGAQDLAQIPVWVENECLRQQGLIAIQTSLKESGIKNAGAEPVDVTQIFKSTYCRFMKKSIEKKGRVYALKMPGFKGLLGKELMPGYRFGTELSERAKQVGLGGIIHSDEDPAKYNFSASELESVKQQLGDEAFIMCVGEKSKLERAFEVFIMPRIKQAFQGVPGEVRKANDDGTTSYLRPIPGSARMYPETDTLPIKIESEDIVLPELLTDRVQRFCTDYGLSEDLAREIVRQDIDFDSVAGKYENLKPSFIAELMISAPKAVKKKYGLEIYPSQEQFEGLFLYLDQGKISKEAVPEIIKQINERPLHDIVADFKSLDENALEQKLQDIVANNPGAPFKALIGIAMKEFRGQADGKKISEILQKMLEK